MPKNINLYKIYTEKMCKNYIKRKDRCFLLHSSVPSCLPSLMIHFKDPTSCTIMFVWLAELPIASTTKLINLNIFEWNSILCCWLWKVKMHLYIWHLSLTAWPYNIDFDRSTSTTYLCLNLKMTSGIPHQA